MTERERQTYRTLNAIQAWALLFSLLCSLALAIWGTTDLLTMLASWFGFGQ